MSQASRATHTQGARAESATAPATSRPSVGKRDEHERRVVQTYESEARRDFNPTDKTQYLNIGYWKDGARSLDEAAEAMAALVGGLGQFDAADVILDAGCGYGDAALFWARRFNPERIVGIDINRAEVARARERAAALKLDGRVEFRVVSAVETRLPAASFSKVASIEASHHFVTREDFFKEAYRLLKGGGRLVTTDVVPLPGRRVHFLNAINSYPADAYVRKLTGAGFGNISVTSIREHVFKPYSNFLLRRLRLTNLGGLVNVLRQRLTSSRLDYIVVTADKP